MQLCSTGKNKNSALRIKHITLTQQLKKKINVRNQNFSAVHKQIAHVEEEFSEVNINSGKVYMGMSGTHGNVNIHYKDELTPFR